MRLYVVDFTLGDTEHSQEIFAASYANAAFLCCKIYPGANVLDVNPANTENR